MFFASLAALSLSVSSARAGLFDDIERLFSGGSTATPAAPPPVELRRAQNGPLKVTVRPRRTIAKKAIGVGVPRVRQSVKAPAKNSQPKAMPAATSLMPAATSLNPDRNSTWYLEDPTLRRGDIAVLKGEVLVFQGGRVPYSRDDFSQLGRSHLSSAEKETLRAVSGVRVDPKSEESSGKVVDVRDTGSAARTE
jgi:hypothetical protein